MSSILVVKKGNLIIYLIFYATSTREAGKSGPGKGRGREDSKEKKTENSLDLLTQSMPLSYVVQLHPSISKFTSLGPY